MSTLLVMDRARVARASWCACMRPMIALLLIGAWTASLHAQVAVDSIALWTSALQTGTLDAKAAAVEGLSRTPVSALPAATVRALLAELGRVNQAVLAGTDPATPGTPEDHGEYYLSLVGIVAELRSPDAALALVPAIDVSAGVQRRVARYGAGTVVAPLVDLVNRRRARDDALETLGLVWFWADSTGSPLSDASRNRILETLAAAALTGDDDDMRGVSAALREMKNPSLLALAQVLRGVAATQGVVGDWSVSRLDESVLPAMTAAAAARTNAALIKGIRQMVTAICGTPPPGLRLGTCESSGNDISAAERLFSSGESGAARNVYSAVADRFRRARDDGTFTSAEYALIAGDLTALLARSW